MSPKDVDKLFREALNEGQANPRPEAWARVAASLPKAEPEAEPKRRTLWWPYAAAASVVIAFAATTSSTAVVCAGDKSPLIASRPSALKPANAVGESSLICSGLSASSCATVKALTCAASKLPIAAALRPANAVGVIAAN